MLMCEWDTLLNPSAGNIRKLVYTCEKCTYSTARTYTCQLSQPIDSLVPTLFKNRSRSSLAQPNLRRGLHGGDDLYCDGSCNRHALPPALEEAAQLQTVVNSSWGDVELFLSVITKITKDEPGLRSSHLCFLSAAPAYPFGS